MKLCYIILAHQKVCDVSRLIDALNCRDAIFVVHIDIKCNEDLTPLKNRINVRVFHKYDIAWGGIQQVEALNYCCEEALKCNTDYYVLLSGSDYPVKSAQYIHDYFKRNQNSNFIGGIKLPDSCCGWAEGGRRRLECYALVLNRAIATIEPRKFSFSNFREIAKVALSRSHYIEACKILLSFPKRLNTSGLQPFGGEFWWRLNRKSLESVTRYRLNHPEYHEWQKWTANCDELYYNTLTYNLCLNNNSNLLTYINWGGAKIA